MFQKVIFKIGHLRPLFVYFCLLNSKYVNYKNIANDWIQTVDLWYQKQHLYQLTIAHLLPVIFLANLLQLRGVFKQS